MFRRISAFFTEARMLGEFARLQKELTQPSTSLSDLLSGRDPLEEFSSLMISRDRIATTLKMHGYEGEAGKEKLSELYKSLIFGGAGQWVGETFVATAVLYDPELLEKILQVEASDDPSPKNMAWAAIEFVEGNR